MKFSIRAAFLLLCICLSFVLGTDGVFCSEPVEGESVMGDDGQDDCAALIRQKCIGMRGKRTTKWRRGIKVRDNCNTIPRLTAIATFPGPPQTPFVTKDDQQHAAIFLFCASDGLVVYDQSRGRPVQYRTLKYGDSHNFHMNDGDKFYTIEV